MTQT